VMMMVVVSVVMMTTMLMMLMLMMMMFNPSQDPPARPRRIILFPSADGELYSWDDVRSWYTDAQLEEDDEEMRLAERNQQLADKDNLVRMMMMMMMMMVMMIIIVHHSSRFSSPSPPPTIAVIITLIVLTTPSSLIMTRAASAEPLRVPMAGAGAGATRDDDRAVGAPPIVDDPRHLSYHHTLSTLSLTDDHVRRYDHHLVLVLMTRAGAPWRLRLLSRYVYRWQERERERLERTIALWEDRRSEMILIAEGYIYILEAGTLARYQHYGFWLRLRSFAGDYAYLMALRSFAVGDDHHR
jgi:hypothetical protein